MTIGERITALRKGRGMTQEQLAEKLSVTRQSVSKWELDQATPEVGCAVVLCDLLCVLLFMGTVAASILLPNPLYLL
jgi:transcriptional regulator with XRE-family HTH domain